MWIAMFCKYTSINFLNKVNKTRDTTKLLFHVSSKSPTPLWKFRSLTIYR